MDDWLKEWIEDNLNDLDTNVNKITSILAEDVFTGDAYSLAIAVSSAVEGLALTIVTICFLIEFLKITINMDVLKWEYGLKVFFKFVFAKVCMSLASTLMSAIYVTAAEWINTVNISTPAGVTTTMGVQMWNIMEPMITGMGFMEVLGMFISMGMVFLVIWVISLLAIVMAYARKFELLVYIAIAPLPCAFLPLEDGGASRIPKKFVMTYASICLQGVFIILSVKLYGMLCTDIITNAGSNVAAIAGNMLIATLVMILAITKSSGWAKSVLDVG